MRVQALLILLLASSGAGAQDDVRVLLPPAERLLRLEAELRLDSAQMSRLRDLARAQATAFSKATSAFLRAEADLIDANRSPDLTVRRTALERRAKSAIDAEMIRLKAEKDARGILTAKQLDRLAITSDSSRNRLQPLWLSQVNPLPLAALSLTVPDSGEVRITTEPLGTEIYVGSRLVGTGRLALRLPVGSQLVLFRTPGGCTEADSFVVVKGPPTMVTHRMSCMK